MISAIISRLVILLFGTLYPAYASYKAVRTKDVKEYVKWMMYWIVFALFTCAETFTDVFLSFWFPFYYEIKIVLVIWLLSPATKGSSILYRNFVHPALTRREQEIDEYISKAKEQGYHTMLHLGSKGVTYATNVLMQTAIKSGGGIVNHLRRSYSLSDLSDEVDTSSDLNRNSKSQGNKSDAVEVPRDPRIIRSSRKPGGSHVDLYFPEMDVSVRSAHHAQDLPTSLSQIRSNEDISSGYSSADHLFGEAQEVTEGNPMLTRTTSVGATRGRTKSSRAIAQPKKTLATEEEEEDNPISEYGTQLDLATFPIPNLIPEVLTTFPVNLPPQANLSSNAFQLICSNSTHIFKPQDISRDDHLGGKNDRPADDCILLQKEIKIIQKEIKNMDDIEKITTYDKNNLNEEKEVIEQTQSLSVSKSKEIENNISFNHDKNNSEEDIKVIEPTQSLSVSKSKEIENNISFTHDKNNSEEDKKVIEPTQSLSVLKSDEIENNISLTESKASIESPSEPMIIEIISYNKSENKPEADEDQTSDLFEDASDIGSLTFINKSKESLSLSDDEFEDSSPDTEMVGMDNRKGKYKKMRAPQPPDVQTTEKEDDSFSLSNPKESEIDSSSQYENIIPSHSLENYGNTDITSQEHIMKGNDLNEYCKREPSPTHSKKDNLSKFLTKIPMGNLFNLWVGNSPKSNQNESKTGVLKKSSYNHHLPNESKNIPTMRIRDMSHSPSRKWHHD